MSRVSRILLAVLAAQLAFLGGVAVGQGPELKLHREWHPWIGTSYGIYAVCDEASGVMVYATWFGHGAAMQILPGGCKR